MILDFLWRVITKFVVIVFFLIDLIGFLVLGNQLPSYVYYVTAIVGLLIGSYLVYAETKSELDKRKDSEPRLELYFATEGTYSRVVEAKTYSPSDKPDFESLVEHKRDELQQKWEDHDPPLVSKSDNLIIRLSRQSWEAYEVAINAYIREYRTYLESLWKFLVDDALIRSFPIVLLNNGSVPAERVTVEIQIPRLELLPTEDEIAWHFFDREQLPTEPPEPDPARSSLESFTDALSSLARIASMSPFAEVNDRVSTEPSGPFYDYESCKISYRAAEVMHNLTGKLNPFVLSLSNIREDSELELKVRLHAANIPHPIDDFLTLRIASSQTPPSQLQAA